MSTQPLSAAQQKLNDLWEEHIRHDWDQASVLVQAGLIERANLPVLGAEVGDKVLDPTRPMNGLIERGQNRK